MMNFGDLKKYLRDGKRREDMIGVPRGAFGKTTSVQQKDTEDEDKQKLAKTFLKVNLAQHDKAYHKGGYKEGDACNFREALKRGDSSDALSAAEKKEGDVKVGFVKFKEDEKTGKKEIVGVEEAEKVKVEGKDEKTVEVAGIGQDAVANPALSGRTDVGEEETASVRQQDAEDRLPVSLAEHDERFHPQGFKEGDSCKVREAMGRGDSADRIEAAEGREAAEKERGESDVAAYEVLAAPIYLGRWKDGRPVEKKDVPRVQAMLDKFMLKHPEIAALNEDATYDLENAVGRTPGWHRNDAKADEAEVWCDEDVDFVVEELLDTPDGNMRDLFDCFYPESHFDDEDAERGRDEAYQQAVRLAVNWAFHDDPDVWAKADAAARNWAYAAKNGHVVDMGAMASAVKRLIGAAAEQVARGNDPVERYLAAK